MKVIFEFKDRSGKALTDNNIEKELTNDEILVISLIEKHVLTRNPGWEKLLPWVPSEVTIHL